MKKLLETIFCVFFVLWLVYSICLFNYAVKHEWLVPNLLMTVWYVMDIMLFISAIILRRKNYDRY